MDGPETVKEAETVKEVEAVKEVETVKGVETVKKVETKPPEQPEVSDERRVMLARPEDCSSSDPLERAMQQLAESIEDVETEGGEAGPGVSSVKSSVALAVTQSVVYDTAG